MFWTCCLMLRSYFMELLLFIIVICISYLYANLFCIDSAGINQHLMQTCSKIKATTPFDSNDPVHDECVSFKFYRLIAILYLHRHIWTRTLIHIHKHYRMGSRIPTDICIKFSFCINLLLLFVLSSNPFL